MHNSHKLPFFIANILILIIFSVLRVSVSDTSFFDNTIQIYEIVTHFFIIFNAYNMYSKCNGPDRRILIWYLVTNIFFMLNDASFYVVLFLSSSAKLLMSTNYPYISLWANNFPFFAWLICIIICMCLMLTKYVINLRPFCRLFLALLVIDILLMSYYWQPVNFHSEILSFWHSFFLIATSVIELIIFELCILCLLYTKNQYVIFIASGFIIAISGDLLTTYGRMAQIARLFLYGDSIWCFGIILIYWGTYGINKSQSFKIKKWFNSINNIKSIISSWSLSISIGGLLLFFIVANKLNLIDKNAIIVSPLVIMLYSIVVVILTIYMGRVLENPFRVIEKNVKGALSGARVDFKNDLKIKEFEKLQQFFINSFELKEQQNLLRKKFGDIAGQAVHDLGSPIKALHVAIRELRSKGIDTEALNLDLSVNRLQDYQTSILSYYRKLTHVDHPDIRINDIDADKYILVSSCMDSIIEYKKFELRAKSVEIELDYSKVCEEKWLKLNSMEFERNISNLLDNAYESLNKREKIIKIHLFIIERTLTIEIKDNGCGIPDNMIDKVMQGQSTKHIGTGLGLSSALEYFTRLNGNLEIDSISNQGTKLSITLPLVPPPSWYFNNINYCHNEIFVILDDDVTVIKQWQKLLLTKGIKFKLFVTVEEYQKWVLNINDLTFRYILISDYDLNNLKTGVDIINECPFEKKYLITGLADTSWLQMICSESEIKLAHKSYISKIALTYNIN